MSFPQTCLIFALGLAAVPAFAAPKAERVVEEKVLPLTSPTGAADDAPQAPKAQVVPEDDDTPEDAPPPKAKGPDKEKAEEKEMPPEKEEARDVRAVPADLKPIPPPVREVKSDVPRVPVNIKTDPNAKPLSQRVPAPRGLIVDRNGQPLAQNRVAHYIGVQLPMREGLTDVQILDFARGPLAFCRAQLPEQWEVSDADIIQHYHKRRWVPILCPSLLPSDRSTKLKDTLLPGVVLCPFFLRSYPENSLAGHLLGQMGKSGAFKSGDLESEEQMWPPTVGNAGLEKRFDRELTGSPGLYTALYDSKGDMLSEEWVERPRAGHTVVTTLDLEMQKIAERNLKERGVRGAFVILDVKTGDILAMASSPCMNPNDYIYGVSDKFYQKQLNDPELPMVCRAIYGLYPPASTFKVVTALAALETDKIDPNSEFGCPTVMYFSGVPMHNHSKHDEGMMDVERAIMRSCNTWFYQVARICGGAALTTMARRFGFGDKTGICLDDMERAGNIPSGALTGGILANTAIGQGSLEATPLQVAQMMAGIARGDAVPRPRLVKLIQDVDGRIVQHFPPAMRPPLSLQKENIAAVQRGMRQVVAGGGGTGSQAENDYVAIAGKTGTGQWHTKPKQNVAWFGGFIPYKNPEYAFVCLYEGDPNETEISGGRKVAPIVGDVFNEIYKAKKKRGELKDDGKEDDDPDSLATSGRRAPRKAVAMEEVRPATPVPEPPKRLTGLRWLFSRNRNNPAPPPPAPTGGRFPR